MVCLCDLKVAYFTTFILNWVQQTTKKSRKQFREYTPVQVVAASAPTYLPAAQSEKYANNNQIQTTTSEKYLCTVTKNHAGLEENNNKIFNK